MSCKCLSVSELSFMLDSKILHKTWCLLNLLIISTLSYGCLSLVLDCLIIQTAYIIVNKYTHNVHKYLIMRFSCY